jgi:hypothetical protein
MSEKHHKQLYKIEPINEKTPTGHYQYGWRFVPIAIDNGEEHY